MTKLFFTLLIAACGLIAFAASSVHACPFCSATSQTLSEELGAADVAVIAELVHSAQMPDEQDEGLQFEGDSGMATFRVVEVLRGEVQPESLGEIKIVYFGEGDEGKRFFSTGISGDGISGDGTSGDGKDRPRFDWTTPFPLSEQAQQYVRLLEGVPKEGAARTTFFQQYLENEDPLLAQDAYEEFARAPYADIVEMGPQIEREKILRWIEDPQVGPSHRRLYLTMLGVCGQAEDIQKLESLLRYDVTKIEPAVAAMVALAGLGGSTLGVPLVDELVKADERRQKQCLDALVAAYLRLTGPAGLPLIEQRYLTNPNATYPHLYSTIMALRFHGEECDAIPRPRLLQSMRMLLDNEEIAEQIIPDLARWEDWSVLERLVEMFKASDEQGWIRQPVVAYMIAASEQPGEVGERAEQAMSELEKIDPKTVERSRNYLALAFLARGKAPSTEKIPSEEDEDATEKPSPVATPVIEKKLEAKPDKPLVEDPNEKPSPSVAEQPNPPSRLMIIGVPLVAALLLMGIFAVLLRGADPRGSDS